MAHLGRLERRTFSTHGRCGDWLRKARRRGESVVVPGKVLELSRSFVEDFLCRLLSSCLSFFFERLFSSFARKHPLDESGLAVFRVLTLAFSSRPSIFHEPSDALRIRHGLFAFPLG